MLDLLVNEEEAMIAASVRDYLSSEFPVERLRPNAKALDAARIRRGMYELGWFSIGLPEAAGGAGLGLVEEMLVQRECGRYLASPSELAVVLAAHCAFHAGNPELVGALVSGQTGVALAFPAVQDGAAKRVAAQVLDWNDGDLLLFWNEQGMGLFDASATNGFELDSCIDESVRMHALMLDLGKPLLWVDAAKAPLHRIAAVLLAARMVGLAEHACDLTVEYARMREQFKQPIGAFQAVKHRCADMGVRWRLAWYQTNLAALTVQAGASDADLNAASAKLVAAQAAHENGRAAIQMHGGIGFQAECDVHWFMKRAHLYDQIGGAVRVQARRIVAQALSAA